MKPIILRLAMPFAASLALAAPAHAAKQAPAAPAAPLTESGEALLARYTARMESLKADILKALPTLDAAKMDAYNKARAAETAAQAALAEVEKGQGEIKKGHGLVGHAKGKWIGGAQKAITAAQAELKAAKTDGQKAAARKKLTEAEEDLKAGQQALVERQAALDAALKKYAHIEADIAKARADLSKAKAGTVAAVDRMGVANVLQSDKLDAKLAAYVVMAHATPNGLATFAQQGSKQKGLIDSMLSDDTLLIELALADGASGGNYGKAMEILDAILVASPEAGNDDTLGKLAVAVALEHATPIKQRNADSATDAPEFVDPVQRFLAYRKAFRNKELDPSFDDLTIFDLRFVVDGEEPDEIAAWGRQMLANYRPDQILTADERWRYVELVRSDIRYGSQDNRFDQPELHFFQNILKNGGVCGRRAFIGRFILRAFGVPTTARPQPGHAALVHRTSDGWVVCLGGGWGAGTTKLGYKKDLDFLATTQARSLGKDYLQVKRAHWIGTVMGEAMVYGFHSTRGDIPFWNTVALNTQRGLIDSNKIKTLAAVGEDIGEANVTKEKVGIIKVKLTEDDRKITRDTNGAITIPAAATTEPTKSNGKIIFMPSNRGGLQLHYERNATNQPFTYTVNVPKGGKYELSAMVCTPSWQQSLLITVNGSGEPVKLPLPHTVGMWESTGSVILDLKPGGNTLKMTRHSDGQAKGFSIHRFTLKPAK